MTNTATAAAAFKDVMFKIATDLFADDHEVLVNYGHSGTADPAPDMIYLLDVGTQQDPATVGMGRSRNEHLTLDIMISSVVAGVDDDQQPTQRAYDLLGQIENYCRTTDPTLGGLVLWCFLTATSSKGATAPESLPNGRIIYCLAQFSALARISNN